jgi:hypothetical protein
LNTNLLISLLDDLGAFKETKSYRIVLKTFLQEGYIQESLRTNDTEFERFVYSVVNNTGFQETVVKEVALALRAAVGKSVPTATTEESLQLLKNKSVESSIISNPLTEQSSNSEILDYLNSIFVVDYESFSAHGLILQDMKLSIKDTRIAFTHRKDLTITFEIIGKRFPAIANLNLYVFDTNQFIREILHLDFLNIANDLSITNETRTLNTTLHFPKIGKLILKTDDLYTTNRVLPFVKTNEIAKYNGYIELKITNITIHELQIFGSLSSDRISFYIDCECSNSIGKNIYASIFDLSGRLRQNCEVMKYIISHGQNNIRYISDEKTTLKIPFNEIGKIVVHD